MAAIGTTLGIMFRETGVALERLGCRMSGSLTFKDPLTRHREVLPVNGKEPRMKRGCFVAPTATVSGDVSLGDGTNVWYGAAVRGDVAGVTIGSGCNIAHRAVVQCGMGEGAKVTIGNKVLIGSGATVNAAEVCDGASVGMGATVEPGAKVEEGAAVAPGAVVAAGTVVAKGTLVSGAPAAFVRNLTADETSKMAADIAALTGGVAAHTAELGKTFAEIKEEKEAYPFSKKHVSTLDDEFGLIEPQLETIW